MSGILTVRVELTGQHRSGTAAKTGNPYTMFEGYVHLPNCPYPEKASFYAESVAQVPQAGMYECDVILNVRDKRVEVSVDPRQGRTMQRSASKVTV